MSQFPSDYFRHKSIRDPLYGFIDLSKTEIELIDTSVFKRLQNIKQLSHAFLVYPSAIHTRFEHSLGATYLADLVCKQLNFEDKYREIIRLAALLHDLGHGPFSHLFEDILSTVNEKKINHDKISILIIKEIPEINNILGEKADQIISILDHKPIKNWDPSLSSLASDVVSSPLDVDKLDYLRRDSYHIGVAYGQFDLHRIIHTLTNTDDKSEKRLCVQDKGKDAIENYSLGRYLMHAQVYQHHTRLIGDQMFVRALDIAVNDEGIIEKDKLKVNLESGSDHIGFLDFYTSLDDRGIYDLIINKKPDGKAAKILNDIRRRKLLKRVYDFLPDKEIENKQIRDKVMRLKETDIRSTSNQIAQQVGLEKQDVVLYISEIPVNLYENEIMIMWKGIPRGLDEFSPIKTSESTIIKFYIFAPNKNEITLKIKDYMRRNFGIDLTKK